MEILLIIAVVLAIASFYLHRSTDKTKEQFENRLSVTTNPSQDLFTNQKYAIIGLLAFIQGASPLSAYDKEANQIVQSTIFSLGLSQQDVERYLKLAMTHDPEEHMNHIIGSLKEIQDRDFIKKLYEKSMRIANISGDKETKEMVSGIFSELGV